MIWTNERIQPLMAEFFCFVKELCTIPNNGLALGAGGILEHKTVNIQSLKLSGLKTGRMFN